MLNTRVSGSSVNGTSNARYTHAAINTDGTRVYGMILFPDGVTIASDEATYWGTINGNSNWGTQCTSAQWTALAAKGCVFLPAAGQRYESTVEGVKKGYNCGYYRSSSPYTENVVNAYGEYFYTNYQYTSSLNRYAGCSVRLVKDVTYDITANLASEAYWATFYSNAGNYQAPEGTQVFTVNLEGTGITMNEVTDRIAKSGEGVVMKKTTAGNFTMTLSETAPAGDFSDNSLTGTMTSITNPGNAYVLGGTNGAGFYKLRASGTIGANKAYLTGPAMAREFFLFEETTSVSEELRVKSEEYAGAVFDLQGRRVEHPTKKDLYIVNGKKIVIK